MKKLVLFTMILLCAFTFDSSAQRKRKRTATSQGNWVLRTGMGFNTFSSTDEQSGFERSNNSFRFSPALSYMVIDNLEIGANVDVWNRNTRNETSQVNRFETEETNFGFGIFAQKYFPLNNWFAFYTRADIGLVSGSGEDRNIVGSETTPTGFVNNGVQGGLHFGFGFTPYNAFAIYSDFAGLAISNMKRNPDGNTEPNTSTTSAGFNILGKQAGAAPNTGSSPINLGIAWYFGRGLWRR
jgi:hypothetical protein